MRVWLRQNLRAARHAFNTTIQAQFSTPRKIWLERDADRQKVASTKCAITQFYAVHLSRPAENWRCSSWQHIIMSSKRNIIQSYHHIIIVSYHPIRVWCHICSSDVAVNRWGNNWLRCLYGELTRRNNQQHYQHTSISSHYYHIISSDLLWPSILCDVSANNPQHYQQSIWLWSYNIVPSSHDPVTMIS